MLDGGGSFSLGSVPRKPLVNLTFSTLHWWLDFGANVYVCLGHFWFFTFKNTSGDVTFGNDMAAQVLGKACLDLTMTLVRARYREKS